MYIGMAIDEALLMFSLDLTFVLLLVHPAPFPVLPRNHQGCLCQLSRYTSINFRLTLTFITIGHYLKLKCNNQLF